MTCKKAQEFLDQENVIISEKINANKIKYNSDQSWEILKNAEIIFVSKGKKEIEWITSKDEKNLILKSVLGPSGNLRAPTWRIKNSFLIGFNIEQYKKVLIND